MSPSKGRDLLTAWHRGASCWMEGLGHFSLAMLVWGEVETLGPIIVLGRAEAHDIDAKPWTTSDGLTQNEGNLQDVPVPQSLQVRSFQTTLSLLFLESEPCSCHRNLQRTPCCGWVHFADGKTEARRAEDYAQGHPEGKWSSQHLNPGPGDSGVTPSVPRLLAERPHNVLPSA